MALNQLLAASQPYSLTGPGIVVTDNASATTAFENFASQIVGALTIVAVLFFITQIIFAGFAFMTSEGDEKVMQSTRKRLTEAVLGLVIVVVAVGIGSLVAMLLGIKNVLDINTMFGLLGL